jgi:hypothetical protein
MGRNRLSVGSRPCVGSQAADRVSIYCRLGTIAMLAALTFTQRLAYVCLGLGLTIGALVTAIIIWILSLGPLTFGEIAFAAAVCSVPVLVGFVLWFFLGGWLL